MGISKQVQIMYQGEHVSSVIITMFAIVSHLLRSGALFLSDIPSNAIYSAWFAFFIPCYATFKTLSNRPISESELQKWAMYWSVIGAFVAFEYVTEWLISWYALFLMYQLLSDFSQKGAVLLGSKDFVLVVFILATDTG